MSKSRRKFLKKIGLGAVAISGPISVSAGEFKIEKEISADSERLNEFEFDFLFSGNRFVGIGDIKIGNTQLRNGKLPMFAQVTTPDALEMVNFRVQNKEVSSQSIEIDFTADARNEDTMEWMLHTVRNRRRIGNWIKTEIPVPDVKLKLVIRPVERLIGKSVIKGFSYQYVYQSEQNPVYKITDRSSWEIGGTAIGNELWMRNGVADSIVEFRDSNDFYSTEWYLPGIANPNIFQFHPLQTHLQGFTFTSSSEGTLVTFPNKVSHIRSLFEKWRGNDAIVHFHEHCNDLGSKLETSPVEVLWIPGQLDRAGRANLYNLIREVVHDELHTQIGMRRERITTYGIIEQWTEPNFDEYTKDILPKLIDAGVKTVFIPNQCQNDMNVWGIENMCCNVDYKIAEIVGENKLKLFCQSANREGVTVEMWGNTAISTLTERFIHHDGKPKGIQFLPFEDSIMEVIRKSESPFIRNSSNAIEADHYTPRFCALNLRDNDIRAYWMKQWKYFHDEIGIGGIFLDSSFNMSSDKFHHAQFDRNNSRRGADLFQREFPGRYRPENEPPKLIHTQYHAHLSWVVEMQKMGYQYCAEDLGVFGINRTGPNLMERIKSFPIWADSFCDFDEGVLLEAGYDPIDIFFQGLAYRLMWNLKWSFKKSKLELGTENPMAFFLLKVFNQATKYMYKREVLEDEKGVLYEKDGVQVLWAFSEFKYSTNENKKVTDLITSKSFQADKILTKKNHVFLIHS